VLHTCIGLIEQARVGWPLWRRVREALVGR
jgi:hypothetical protein